MSLVEHSSIGELESSRNSFQNFQLKGGYMEVRSGKKPLRPANEGRKIEYQRTFSGGNGRRLLPASYFSLESLLLLVCLTASLLILPLILPPLPPPPFLLLLLPIGLLGVLMFLAFMPSNIRDLTYTYA